MAVEAKRKILLISRIQGIEWERLWSATRSPDGVPPVFPCQYAHIDETGIVYKDVSALESGSFLAALQQADVTVLDGKSLRQETGMATARQALSQLNWYEVARSALILVHVGGGVWVREKDFQKTYSEFAVLAEVAGSYSLNLSGSPLDPRVYDFANAMDRRSEPSFKSVYRQALARLRELAIEESPALTAVPAPPEAHAVPKPQQPKGAREEKLPPFYSRLQSPLKGVGDLKHRVFPLFGPIALDLLGWEESGFDTEYQAEIQKAYSRWPDFDRLEVVRTLLYRPSDSLQEIVRSREKEEISSDEETAAWKKLSSELLPATEGQPADIHALLHRLGQGTLERGDPSLFSKWYGRFQEALDTLEKVNTSTPQERLVAPPSK